MPCLRGLHQPNNLGRNECLVRYCGCGGMVDAADSKSASGDRVGFKSLQPYQLEPDDSGL